MPDANNFQAEELRRCGIDDLPFILSLAYERYRAFDPGRTLIWLAQTLQNPLSLMLRAERAFLIASIAVPAWHPNEKEAHVLFVCAGDGYHWQACTLLRQSVDWARGQGCVSWHVSSETEYDIEPLARRLGAEPWVTRYKLRLTDAG